MRNEQSLLAVVGLVLLVGAAPSTRASPIGIAVAGVGGAAADPDELKRLAGILREELSARVDNDVFAVVSRDEMARVYEARGAPCALEDARCLAAVSARWSGRLLVRGRLANTPTGLVFTVSLDSVRGLHVADAAAPIDSIVTAGNVVPQLVDKLLAKERVFRERMNSASNLQKESDERDASSSATSGGEEHEPFVCHASQQGLISWGDVSLDGGGMTFTSPLTNKWRKRWSQLTTVTSTIYKYHPAVYVMTANEYDPLYIWFDTSAQRDRCVNEINRELDEHRRAEQK